MLYIWFFLRQCNCKFRRNNLLNCWINRYHCRVNRALSFSSKCYLSADLLITPSWLIKICSTNLINWATLSSLRCLRKDWIFICNNLLVNLSNTSWAFNWRLLQLSKFVVLINSRFVLIEDIQYSHDFPFGLLFFWKKKERFRLWLAFFWFLLFRL